MINNIPTIHVPTINLGQKMIMKIGGNRNSWHQWGEVVVTQNVGLFSFWVDGSVGEGGHICLRFDVPNVLHIWFPICSHQVCKVYLLMFPISPSSWCIPNGFPFHIHHHILPHVLCPKLYFCNLCRQPKGKDNNTFILGVPKVWSHFILIGQSKKLITQKENWTFGDPHNN